MKMYCTMRKPTSAERHIWPTADHVVEPVVRSCMPPTDGRFWIRRHCTEAP